VPGTVSDVRYDGSSAAPVNAGSYAVTADFVPADATNYESLADASAGDFGIEKAVPTLAVTNSPVTYSGWPQEAVVAGSVPGTVGHVRYDGSSAEPVNAGSYAVTADFVPADATNYESLADASAGDFVIEKAVPTLLVTNSPVIYSGSPQEAVVAGSVPGTVSDVRYDGSSAAPTDPGAYAVTADFLPDDAVNYEALNDASAGNFVINPPGPNLALVKTPDLTTFNWMNVVITYQYQLTNTGDVTLEGPFTVADDRVTVTCPSTASLAPTESITCTATYTTTWDDVVAGEVTNTAVGSGFFLGEAVASASAQATVTSTAARLFLPVIYR
jgi:hypothetical protein